jgi:hypothetical protein
VRLKRHRTDGSKDRGIGVVKYEKDWAKPELDGQDAYVELEVLQTATEITADDKYQAWEMHADSSPAEME